MLFSKIGNEYRYNYTAAEFKTAFAFLCRKDLGELPEGWVTLGDGVRASVQHYSTMPAGELAFETHERFFDIQYIIEGAELVGVAERAGLKVKQPYDAGNDVTFYFDPAQAGSVLLTPGDFVVLGPEDAHKPRCAAGKSAPVKKIVVKVPVQK